MTADGGRGLAAFAALSVRIRRAALRLAARLGRSPSLPARIRQLLEAQAPNIAAVVTDAQILEWARAASAVASVAGLTAGGPRSPGVADLLAELPRGPLFPQVEAAAAWVLGLEPVDPAEFALLTSEARRVAFTVARAQTEDAVRVVQEAVAADVAGGGSLAGFRERVTEALDGSALSDSEVEALYRTHVGRAYAAGQRAVLDSPGVRSAVPYLQYTAVHDSRTRANHLALEVLGLDGTAVYRADDPIWDQFTPPWEWNCRCALIPTPVRVAAEMGVREAREWLKSGRPPAEPEFVDPPPFAPPAGWVPSGRRLTPLV